LQATIDGSIIDEDVNPTEALHGLCCHRLGTLGVGDICRDPQRLATGLLNFGNGLGARQDVRGDYP
jgi:hypothetical protein